MSTLDSFVQPSKTNPKAVATSQEIRDRSSIFVASIYHANNLPEAKAAVTYHKNVVHGSRKATHEIAAWRFMALKHSRDGLAGPDDFEVRGGSEDDGETYAGGKVLKAMEAEGIVDAVVIVSRWYGGIMLGPVRFSHIDTCTREVCRTFKALEEVQECMTQLNDLDLELAKLRAELAALSDDGTSPTSSQGTSQQPDYTAILESVDLNKARRLLNARRNAIKSVRSLITSKRKATSGA